VQQEEAAVGQAPNQTPDSHHIRLGSVSPILLVHDAILKKNFFQILVLEIVILDYQHRPKISLNSMSGFRCYKSLMNRAFDKL
jgi:hypothetical protein